MNSTEPRFFKTQSEFRAWLEEHHEQARELVVGFHRRASGKPSLTWPESVDEALCFGWIDSIRRSIDGDSYSNRFTPRRRRSNWSAVNIRRYQELAAMGRVRPAGRRAFEERTPERSGVYSYENRHLAELDPEQESRFRAQPKAWRFFQSRPPSYRKTVTWWVISAKQEETRARRLQTLIEESAQGRLVGLLTRVKKGA